MAATYDITTHPLLGKKAKALLEDGAQSFDAVVVASERNIGLHGTSFTDADGEDAKLAVVYEVNFQLERSIESEVYKSLSRRGRTWTFSTNDSSPSAKRIADRLLSTLKKATSRSSKSMSVGVTRVW